MFLIKSFIIWMIAVNGDIFVEDHLEETNKIYINKANLGIFIVDVLFATWIIATGGGFVFACLYILTILDASYALLYLVVSQTFQYYKAHSMTHVFFRDYNESYNSVLLERWEFLKWLPVVLTLMAIISFFV